MNTSLGLCPSGPKQKGLKAEPKFRRKNGLADLVYELKQIIWEKGRIDFEISGKGLSRFKPVPVSFQDEHSLTLKVNGEPVIAFSSAVFGFRTR